MAEENRGNSVTAPQTVAGAGDNAGETLVLRDLLPGEHDPNNVSSNLQFRYDDASGATTIELTVGAPGAQHQSIVLQGADLTSGGSLNDTQIIQMLLTQSKPATDL